MKEAAKETAQRAGGRCEPAGDFCFSAFGAGGEEPRGAPLTARRKGQTSFFRRLQFGWYRGKFPSHGV